jgi:hypothetical protein
VTLACGDGPVTISVAEAIEVGQPTVIEGAGQVTLDGGGSLQILVVGTDQSLSVGNLLFINGVVGREPAEPSASTARRRTQSPTARSTTTALRPTAERSSVTATRRTT